MIALFLACSAEPGDSADSANATDTGGFHGGYHLATWADPEPITAGEETEFYVQITDDAGVPIEDLQTNHERIIHNIFVSADLESFQHVHMEDFYTLSADDIRNATYHFPITFPTSGEYLGIYDYAHRNQWLKETQPLSVAGDVPQLSSYIEDYSTTVVSDDVSVSVSWESSPVAGFEASFSFNVKDLDGNDVVDLTQYLGADAHLAVVSADLGYANHTHAWFPDMGDMAPSMDMPHLYPGPDVPFVFTFPVGGTYKMWVQFARESKPSDVYAVPFLFDVAG